MGVILLSACQQATCSFAQRLPLLNILAVVLFGVPIFAVLIHFSLQAWRAARFDLREWRKARASVSAVARVGGAAPAAAVSAVTILSAYARMLWSLSVALLCADWVYFCVYNVKRLATSQPSDLRFPAGSALALEVGLVVWVVSLLAVAVLWKMRPRRALPPMLKRSE